MKDLLAWWIAFQLIMVGMVSSEVMKEIDQGIYDCSKEFHLEEGESAYYLYLVPVIWFMTEPREVRTYCAAQERSECDDS